MTESYEAKARKWLPNVYSTSDDMRSFTNGAVAFARLLDSEKAQEEKPVEKCGRDLAFGCEDYLPCALVKGHKGSCSALTPKPPVKRIDPVEELGDIGCLCRCREYGGSCPHKIRRLCGCRDCSIESKLNEVIRKQKEIINALNEKQ